MVRDVHGLRELCVVLISYKRVVALWFGLYRLFLGVVCGVVIVQGRGRGGGYWGEERN
jgi:hypothetical protein